MSPVILSECGDKRAFVEGCQEPGSVQGRRRPISESPDYVVDGGINVGRPVETGKNLELHSVGPAHRKPPDHLQRFDGGFEDAEGSRDDLGRAPVEAKGGSPDSSPVRRPSVGGEEVGEVGRDSAGGSGQQFEAVEKAAIRLKRCGDGTAGRVPGDGVVTHGNTFWIRTGVLRPVRERKVDKRFGIADCHALDGHTHPDCHQVQSHRSNLDNIHSDLFTPPDGLHGDRGLICID